MRRLLLICALLLALFVAFLVALPWWWGAAVRVAGGRAGLDFQRYDRIGYGRWALHDVVLEQPGFRLTLERVEASHPFGLWFERGEDDAPPLEVGAWTFEWRGAPDKAPEQPADGLDGWVATREKVREALAQLDAWLPPVRLGAGTVRWPGGEARVEGVELVGRELKLAGGQFQDRVVDVGVNWPEATDRLELTVVERGDGGRLQLASVGAEVDVTAEWWGQPVEARAVFAPVGWLPETAQVQAENWRVPGERVQLGEHVEQLAGDLRLDWRDGRFTTKLRAEGRPVEGGDLPVVTAEVDASGDLEAVEVRRLHVRAPGLQAWLDRPVNFTRSGGLNTPPSAFRLELDLAALPWIEADGRVAGRVDVRPQAEGTPHLVASLRVDEVVYEELPAVEGEVLAALRWPRLEVEAVQLTAGDAGDLRLRGAWDLESRRAAGIEVEARVAAALVARWLPEDVDFDEAELTASAEGPWPEVLHAGELRVAQALVGGVRRSDVAVRWHGTGIEEVDTEVTVANEAASLALTARAGPKAAELRTLLWRRATGDELVLTTPARVAWSPALAVENLRLVGEGTREVAARVNGGEAVDFAVRVASIGSEWVADWVEVPGPEWRIEVLEAEGGWTDGPLRLAATAAAELELGSDRSAQIKAVVKADEEGLRLQSIDVAEAATPILSGRGRLPLTIWPGTARTLRPQAWAPVELELASAPNPRFWSQVAELSGVGLQDPNLQVDLDGSWQEPRGVVSLDVARVAVDPERWAGNWPEIANLRARLVGVPAGLELEQLDVEVAGQALRASGRLPLSPEQWDELAEEPLAYLRRAGEARIEIPDADVAELARFVPEYLAPTGRMSLELTVAEGGDVRGFFRLSGAATRPLGPLGVLQDVRADVRVADRTLVVKTIEATMGGQTIALSGQVGLSDELQPRFDLSLKGQNLPFVRQTGLLVRGDLDLRVLTGETGQTRITGQTRLRDSLFLVDLRALLPGGGGGGGGAGAPSRRPPYFSVAAEPFDDWGLDVQVVGQRFLRLRTPVFDGVASADFRLVGTLEEPRSIGQATINDGRVRLPFANFEVTEGWVRLTEAAPFQPEINFIGETRRFGYDIRMEVTGTAATPNLQFFSSPPLASEQVLLMVMAGEVPGDEVNYSTTQRATRLGTYLGQNLFSQFSGNTGGEERLTITSGEKVSRQGRETYRFEYQLTPRWALTGGYDEFDDYNAGIRWRIYPRRTEREREQEKEEENDAEE